MKRTSYKIPNPPKEQLLSINSFSGINLALSPTQIADNECSDMLNMFISKSGVLEKRYGYQKLFEGLGSKITGMHLYRKAFGQEYFIFSCGTKLYKLNGDYTYTEVYDGLNNDRVTFFTFNNLCYILDGVNYKVYDGTTVTDVVGYVPTLFTETPPAGGGNELEQINLLTGEFKQSFTADGTSKDYFLCQQNLDATPIKASIDYGASFNKIEGTDFTVDRATGKVSFLTAPTKENPDSVVIWASKTTAGLSDRIKKCRDYVFYGGMNDSHILLYGNLETPSVIYRSGVVDPTYFPEGYYQAIGNTTEQVMKLVVQYDICVILKERSIWHMTMELNTDSEATYPVRPLNDSVGCVNPYTVQLLDNTPAYLNVNGIYTIVQSNIREEKNVQIISERINKLLLKDTIRTSVDFQNRYYLVGQNKTYVFDYLLDAWFIWDSIDAECFLEADNKLYFGDSQGAIHRFKNEDDTFPYNDNGEAVKAFWKSKAFGFKHSENNKLVQKLFITMSPYKRSGAYFYYVTDVVQGIKSQANLPSYANFSYAKSLYNDRIFDAKSEYIDQLHFELFDYSDLDYKWFSYNANSYPPESVMKVKAKKIPYYQFVIQNNKINENVGIDEIVIKYYIQSYRK